MLHQIFYINTKSPAEPDGALRGFFGGWRGLLSSGEDFFEEGVLGGEVGRLQGELGELAEVRRYPLLEIAHLSASGTIGLLAAVDQCFRLGLTPKQELKYLHAVDRLHLHIGDDSSDFGVLVEQVHGHVATCSRQDEETHLFAELHHSRQPGSGVVDDEKYWLFANVHNQSPLLLSAGTVRNGVGIVNVGWILVFFIKRSRFGV